MKVLKGIIHVLAWICYVAIAVYAIICIPLIFGHKPLVVLSDSMEPNIKEGSIIYYKKVPKKEIKEGNIISFKISDKIVSHRVYKVDDSGFTTKGDATSTIDPVVITYDQVLGKVDSIVLPYIGYYIKTVNNHYYIVIGVVIILILEFVTSNISRKKDDDLVEETTDESTEETPKEEVTKEEPVEEETKVIETTIEKEEPEKEFKTEVFNLDEIKEVKDKEESSDKEDDEEIEIL